MKTKPSFLYLVSFVFCLALCPSPFALSQIPQGFNYQAIARDGSGNILPNTPLQAMMYVQSLSTGGTLFWKELHSTITTNSFGLFTLVVGNGIRQTESTVATFNLIDWSVSPKYLKTEIYYSGSWKDMGTTQLLSVPYALHSKTSADTDDLQADIEELKFFTGKYLTDIDGNIYTSVLIGNQIWMAENLKTTKYNDGTPIPLVTDAAEWSDLITPGYCWYNNDETTYKNPYGALYNWNTINTNKLCPTGWHAASNEEFNTLVTFLGGNLVAGGKLKESGITHWNSPNTGATNKTGFTGVAAGFRNSSGSFIAFGAVTYFWSTTENGGFPYCMFLFFDVTNAYQDTSSKPDGLSVRCVKD